MKLDYQTWFEVFSIDSDNKWEILIEESIRIIQAQLTDRDLEKYGSFLEWLEKTEIVLKIMKVPKYEKRIELLRYMYYWLRLLDDICDWDTLVDISLEERKKIVEWKFWVWLYDELIDKVLEIAEELWESDWIKYSIDEIVASLKFDVDRLIDLDKYRTKEQLDKNFHKMDIDWTIFWTSIIFWLIPSDTIEKLWWLWEATRISFNIKDLESDIIEWLINITLEDLKKYWIWKDCLYKLKKWEISDNIQQWIFWEITRIQNLLKEYNREFSLFNLIKWWWIKISYKTGYFRKIFNNLLLKYLVLPKGYINEINSIVWDI